MKAYPRKLYLRGNVKMETNGCDHSQMAAGKVAEVCGRFHAKISITLSKLLLGVIWKTHLIVKQKISFRSDVCKMITSHSEMLQPFAKGCNCNCDHLGFDVTPYLRWLPTNLLHIKYFLCDGHVFLSLYSSRPGPLLFSL